MFRFTHLSSGFRSILFPLQLPSFSFALALLKTEGVEGLESGCLNRLWWQWRCFPWAPGEVCCAHTALSFVDHVAELFGALLAPADGPADRPGPTVVGSAGMEAEGRRLGGRTWKHLKMLFVYSRHI